MTTKQKVIQLKGGHDNYICFDCATEHSDNPPYSDILTVHKAECYICNQTKTVGPAYKLLGFYKRRY